MKVMAAFAVHIAMHILAMVASAISFMIVKIAKAISLTGMAFFSQAITLLQTIVVALGAGLGVWGVINLLEGYGNDNPGAKSQGIKQLMAGVGVALVGTQLVPLLSGLFQHSHPVHDAGALSEDRESHLLWYQCCIK